MNLHLFGLPYNAEQAVRALICKGPMSSLKFSPKDFIIPPYYRLCLVSCFRAAVATFKIKLIRQQE